MKENLPYEVYIELRTLYWLAMMISLRKKITGDLFSNIGSQSRIVVERGTDAKFLSDLNYRDVNIQKSRI